MPNTVAGNLTIAPKGSIHPDSSPQHYVFAHAISNGYALHAIPNERGSIDRKSEQATERSIS